MIWCFLLRSLLKEPTLESSVCKWCPHITWSGHKHRLGSKNKSLWGKLNKTQTQNKYQTQRKDKHRQNTNKLPYADKKPAQTKQNINTSKRTLLGNFFLSKFSQFFKTAVLTMGNSHWEWIFWQWQWSNIILRWYSDGYHGR